MVSPDTDGLVGLVCDNAANLKWLVPILGAHFGCKAVTILTKTPDPSTKLGRVYHYIEIGAGLLGRAKQTFGAK